MPDYKYSKQDYMRLTNASCIEVALALGMEIDEKKSDAKSLKIKGEQGLCIFREGNNWYRFSDGKGGFPIDLVKDKLSCDTEQALDFISRNVVNGVSEKPRNYKRNSESRKELPKEKNFVIPPHAIQPKRVMAYLIKTRGIDPEIVETMIQRKMIAEDDVHHNCLFFRKDSSGNIRSCAVRGSTSAQFRGEVAGGDKSYSFCLQGKNHILRLFESPIDAMSNATFSKLLGRDWTSDHRLSVNGSGAYESIKRYVKEHPEIKSVCFSYDNDEAGKSGVKASAEKLKQDFPDRNLKIKVYYPFVGKDWNEDLQIFREREKQGVNIKDFLNSPILPNEVNENSEDEEPEP